MTTSLGATDKHSEQMMQMLTGFWMTQLAGAANWIADHLAKEVAVGMAPTVLARYQLTELN